MDDLDTLVRFLHLVGVTTWVGGLVFLGGVAVPVARMNPDPAQKRALITAIARRFGKAAAVAWLLILVTGMALMHHRGVSFSDVGSSEYVDRIFTKFLLLMAMGVVAVLHSFWQGPKVRRAEEAGDPETARKWKILGACFDGFTLIASFACLWLAVSLVA